MPVRHFLSVVCLIALTVVIAPLVQAQSATSANTDTSLISPQVIMRTTMGDITLELDAVNSPRTVENFLAYVDDGFYTGTLFHRVIEGFMIQGGGFTSTFRRKTTRQPVSNEAYNGLRNLKYTIAMARTTAPHSATSQFFINTEDNSNLDHTDTSPRGWGYTVFGRVVDGRQIVDSISQSKTGSGGHFRQDVPVNEILITGVELRSVTDHQTSDVPNQVNSAPSANTASKTGNSVPSKTGVDTLITPSATEVAPNTETVQQN